MSYDPVRALTAPELALLRSDQYSTFGLVVIPQQTILACKCSGSLVSNDSVTNIPYNTVTAGSYTGVRAGMTCYVGSGSSLSDLGMVRVKSASGSSLTVGRVSGINWSSSVYLTVVDDFGIWAKLPTLDLTDIKMDDDVVYAGQNTYMKPTPIMGPDTALPYTSGSTTFDGSNSYCLDGTSIVNFAWNVYNGATLVASVSGSAAAVASWTFPAPGSYVVELTVTSAQGVSTTGHRNIYVYNDTTYKPIDQMVVNSISGARQDGGWNAELKIYDSAAFPTLRDRAKAILISKDVYGGSVVSSIGQYAGSEHVIMVGWISTETIEYDFEISSLSVKLQGAAYWIQQCTGPSTFIENVATTPAAWTSIQNLTIDKVIWHFFAWRSNVEEVLDVYRSLNTRVIGGMSASIGSIWEQINETATSRMLMYLVCDRYGRFMPMIDPQVRATADRSSIVSAMTFVKDDLAENVKVERTIVSPIALLEVAGLASNGEEVLMFMSRAPGSLIYNRFGNNDQNDRLVVSSQDDANLLSGMLLAKKNNEYGDISLVVGEFNHALDIAPAMYVKFTVVSTDTLRGISFSNKNLLIKSIRYNIAAETGVITTELECEAETSGIPGYTVEVPQEPIYNFPTEPVAPIYNITPIVYTPITIPPYVNPLPTVPNPALSGSDCSSGSAAFGPVVVGLTGGEVLSTDRAGVVIPLPGYVRGYSGSGTSVPYPSSYKLSGYFQKIQGSPQEGFSGSSITYVDSIDDDWYEVVALNSAGQVIATGVHGHVYSANQHERSGTFVNTGVGGNAASFAIRAKVSETMALSGSYIAIGSGDVTDACGVTDYFSYPFNQVLSVNATNAGWHFAYSAMIANTYGDWYLGRSSIVGLTVSGSALPWFHIIGNYQSPFPNCDLSYVKRMPYEDNKLSGSGVPSQSYEIWTQLWWYNHNLEILHEHAGGGLAAGRTMPIAGDVFIEIIPTYKIELSGVTLYNVCLPT